MQESRVTTTFTLDPKAAQLLDRIAKSEGRSKSKQLDQIIYDFAKRNRVTEPATK